MAQESSIDQKFSTVILIEDTSIPALAIPPLVGGNLSEMLGNSYECPNSQPNPIGAHTIKYIGDNGKYNSAILEEQISETCSSFPDVFVQPLDGSVYKHEVIPEGFSLYYPCLDNVDPIYIPLPDYKKSGIFAPENCHNTDSTVQNVKGFTPYFPCQENVQPVHIRQPDYMEPGIRPTGNYRNDGLLGEFNPGLLPVCRTVGSARHQIFSAKQAYRPESLDMARFTRGNFMQGEHDLLFANFSVSGTSAGPPGNYRSGGPPVEYNPAMLPVCRNINSGQHRIFAARRIRKQLHHVQHPLIQAYNPPFHPPMLQNYLETNGRGRSMQENLAREQHLEKSLKNLTIFYI